MQARAWLQAGNVRVEQLIEQLIPKAICAQDTCTKEVFRAALNLKKFYIPDIHW